VASEPRNLHKIFQNFLEKTMVIDFALVLAWLDQFKRIRPETNEGLTKEALIAWRLSSKIF
jgi:hypothetical protein